MVRNLMQWIRRPLVADALRGIENRAGGIEFNGDGDGQQEGRKENKD